MTIPLWCLPIACLLPYLWSVATVPGRAAIEGGLDNREPRAQQAKLTGMGARAVAAHQNAWEALPPFVAAVLTAHVVGADPVWSARLAVIWVALRITHGAVYLANIHPLRSLSFMGGLGCVLGLFALAAMA